MGIFSGLFKSRDKPENRTPGSSYAFYLGGSSSGKPGSQNPNTGAPDVIGVVSAAAVVSLAAAAAVALKKRK